MNDIHTETWDILFSLPRKNKSKTVKKTEPSAKRQARPFIPRKGSLGGDTVLESDLPMCPVLELERG